MEDFRNLVEVVCGSAKGKKVIGETIQVGGDEGELGIGGGQSRVGEGVGLVENAFGTATNGTSKVEMGSER